MGMYTELHFNCELAKNVPDAVVDLLKVMVGDGELDAVEFELPEHPLFKTSRWLYMLRCDSYYFDADTHSTLRFDDIANHWFLCIRCNLKNYDGEIQLFLSWIYPYLDKYDGKFLGFYRYEETEEPTLIYAVENAIECRLVSDATR